MSEVVLADKVILKFPSPVGMNMQLEGNVIERGPTEYGRAEFGFMNIGGGGKGRKIAFVRFPDRDKVFTPLHWDQAQPDVLADIGKFEWMNLDGFPESLGG